MASLTLTPATAKPDEPVFAKFTGAKPQRLVKFWQGTVLLGSDKSGKAGNANITFPAKASGQVTAKDNFGHSASATLTVTAPPPPTDQPPVIKDIGVGGITQTGFIVTWVTSETTQGWVEYGVSTAYGKDTPHETSFDYTSHTQPVSGLAAGTTYHFRVHAVDQAGQHAVSPDQVALTSGAIVEPPPPPPPPPPTGRPWPAPVTTQTVKLPTSIPNDGTGDIEPAFEAWLKTVGDGSIIEFPAGSFRFPKLLFQRRKNLVLVGQGEGTKLLLSGPGLNSGAQEAAFLLRYCQHIQIRDFDVTGGNKDKVNIYQGGHENQHILCLSAWYGDGPSSYVEMTGVTGREIYTDIAYLEGEVVGAQRPSDHVWIHHNGTAAKPIAYVGRNHISSIAVNDLLVEDNHFDKVGGAPWDIEPNFAYEQVKRNTFRRNKIGSYGHMTAFAGWFVVAAYVEASPVEDIVVDDNDVVGNPRSGNDGTPRGLNTKLVGKYTGGAFPRLTVRFTNNRTTQPAHGPVLYCGPGVGVAQSGNVQPLLSGSFTNCVP